MSAGEPSLTGRADVQQNSGIALLDDVFRRNGIGNFKHLGLVVVAGSALLNRIVKRRSHVHCSCGKRE